MSEFKIGQVVQLNGGGILMTVGMQRQAGLVRCVWMSRDGNLLTADIGQGLLKSKEPDILPFPTPTKAAA